jgi:MurNAc alpha-1-phosphate uridylyltransferase
MNKTTTKQTPVQVPKHAMVLAAGFGKRLRPITESLPKALVPVAGRPLIDYALDRLEAAGVEQVVVNTHHLADRVAAHLGPRARPRIVLSHEQEILETGGGVLKALPLLGPDPFLVVNGKIMWRNGKDDALLRLARAWDGSCMDALLLLHPTVTAVGYDGPGDFRLDPQGLVARRREWEVAPFVFSGVQMLHPRLFAGAPLGPFSLNLLYDRAIEAGRLYGLRHDGEWYQVSTPRQLAEVEARLASEGRSLYGR